MLPVKLVRCIKGVCGGGGGGGGDTVGCSRWEADEDGVAMVPMEGVPNDEGVLLYPSSSEESWISPLIAAGLWFRKGLEAHRRCRKGDAARWC